jgi:hypothetical protein
MDGAHGGIKDRFPRLGKNDRDEMWMQLSRAAEGCT